MVAFCDIGIIHLVLLISQKDYVLYKRRINIVCARHAVTTFGNSGFKENKIGSPLTACGGRNCRFAPPNELSNRIRHDIVCKCCNRMMLS